MTTLTEQCREAFEWLTKDHSFLIASRDQATVILSNATTELVIDDCFMNESRLLIRKKQLDPKARAQSYVIEDVLEARTGKIQPQIEGVPDLPLGQLSFETQLKYYSAALRMHAQDLISGDFSLFDSLDEKKYGRKNDVREPG